MKKFSYTINGTKYNVEIKSVDGNNVSVEVNGQNYDVVLDRPEPAPAPQKPEAIISAAQPTAKAVEPAPAPKTQAAPSPKPATGSTKSVISPLPGVIISVLVNEGDAVKKGQKILVLEAMKMENDIKADRDGIVASVNVSKGDSVQEGDTLITIG